MICHILEQFFIAKPLAYHQNFNSTIQTDESDSNELDSSITLCMIYIRIIYYFHFNSI